MSEIKPPPIEVKYGVRKLGIWDVLLPYDGEWYEPDFDAYYDKKPTFYELGVSLGILKPLKWWQFWRMKWK